MADPTYIRLYDEDVHFLRILSREQHLEQSKLIKNLLHEAVQYTKLKLAVQKYKEGLKTIREAAEFSGLRYHEFLDTLAQGHLLGPTAEEQERLMKETVAALK